MLIRFFKENNLIGCGGDIQPIRLQVGNLSQSDYRCAQGSACAGGPVRRGCACRGSARRGCTHRGSARKGCARRGSAAVVGTFSQSDYRWGTSANQITGVRRGSAHVGGLCAGVACAGGLHAQGVCACRGYACRGSACRGCARRGSARTGVARAGGLHTGVAHAGGLHAGVARAGGSVAVVGTFSQSDYRWGTSANQITGARRGLRAQGDCVQGLPLATIDLVGDNREFEV